MRSWTKTTLQCQEQDVTLAFTQHMHSISICSAMLAVMETKHFPQVITTDSPRRVQKPALYHKLRIKLIGNTVSFPKSNIESKVSTRKRGCGERWWPLWEMTIGNPCGPYPAAQESGWAPLHPEGLGADSSWCHSTTRLLHMRRVYPPPTACREDRYKRNTTD